MATIIPFPALQPCETCSGSGFTWIKQRRTGRNLCFAKCKDCKGTGKVRRP